MTAIYVCWQTEQLEGMTATALMSDNASELRHLSSDFERAANDLKQWAMANGGSVIMDLTTKGCIAIPPEKASDMTDVQAKFEEVTNNSIAVGMGMTISEAHTALRHSVLNGNKISLYTPEMEQEVINDDGYGDWSNKFLGKSELRKDDGPEAPEAPPADVQPSAEGAGMGSSPEDVQGETGQAPAGSNTAPGAVQAAPQGSGATNIDEAERQKEAASGGEGGEDPKAMIMSALQEIKANSGAIEKLKTTAPAAYAAVKDVVQAMITMAESMAKSEGDEDFEYLGKALVGPFNAADPTHMAELANLKNDLLKRNKTEPANWYNDWERIDQTYGGGRGMPVQHVLEGVPHTTFQSINWPDKKVHVTQGPQGGYMLYENQDGTLEGINPHGVYLDGSHPNNMHPPENQDVIAYEKQHHPKVKRYREIQQALEAEEAKQAAEAQAEAQRQKEMAARQAMGPDPRTAAELANPTGTFSVFGPNYVRPKKPTPVAAQPAPVAKPRPTAGSFGVSPSDLKGRPARAPNTGLKGQDKAMSDYYTKLAGERDAATKAADQEIKEGGGK